ncbi:MAG: uroporphyrinogen decarboxylase family protein [Candidatus Geothermincolia bacterium]
MNHVGVMTPSERIWTAVRLGKPDRVPVVPHYDFFASAYGGINQHEMFFDMKKADEALRKTIEAVGPIDGQGISYAGMGRVFESMFPVLPVMPGKRGAPPDGQFQFMERSVMEAEEYRNIAEMGSFRWMLGKLRVDHPEMRSTIGVVRGLGGLGVDARKISASARRWRRQGVESLVGPNLTFTPLEWISIALRSFKDLTLDLFRHPDDLKIASKAMVGFFEKIGVGLSRISGIPIVFMGGNRTSASFMSPRQFEELALPEWEEMCTRFVRGGITPLLHMDSDWTPFFHYLKHLPRGKCILNLDGTSDIRAAKEILGDHMCLMGDVPAAMLKLGTPDEVSEYCRLLIRDVGDGGGFILGSGCSVPPDARPDNVRAMLRSVKQYKP